MHGMREGSTWDFALGMAANSVNKRVAIQQRVDKCYTLGGFLLHVRDTCYTVLLTVSEISIRADLAEGRHLARVSAVCQQAIAAFPAARIYRRTELSMRMQEASGRATRHFGIQPTMLTGFVCCPIAIAYFQMMKHGGALSLVSGRPAFFCA